MGLRNIQERIEEEYTEGFRIHFFNAVIEDDTNVVLLGKILNDNGSSPVNGAKRAFLRSVR